MADVEFEGNAGYRAAGQMLGAAPRYLNVMGALTSVALVVGLGYWGYRLAVRDMTGIPVVQAMAGPMRIAPQDPGGEITAHQGLSVNSVAADGAASHPADRLILAPRPVDLTEEDTAGTAVSIVGDISARAVSRPGLSIGAVPETGGDALVARSGSDVDNAVLLALADQVSAGAIALSGELGAEQSAIGAPRIALPKGALAQSPRPMPRPNRGEVTLAAASATAVPESDGSALTAGTRLVQLGAFDSAETARKEWDRLGSKFADLLVGKTRIVQAAQSGGRTFYRLRAEGFADESDSRRFCSALVAERAACIPVTVR